MKCNFSKLVFISRHPRSISCTCASIKCRRNCTAIANENPIQLENNSVGDYAIIISTCTQRCGRKCFWSRWSGTECDQQSAYVHRSAAAVWSILRSSLILITHSGNHLRARCAKYAKIPFRDYYLISCAASVAVRRRSAINSDVSIDMWCLSKNRYLDLHYFRVGRTLQLDHGQWSWSMFAPLFKEEKIKFKT